MWQVFPIPWSIHELPTTDPIHANYGSTVGFRSVLVFATPGTLQRDPPARWHFRAQKAHLN